MTRLAIASLLFACGGVSGYAAFADEGVGAAEPLFVAFFVFGLLLTAFARAETVNPLRLARRFLQRVRPCRFAAMGGQRRAAPGDPRRVLRVDRSTSYRGSRRIEDRRHPAHNRRPRRLRHAAAGPARTRGDATGRPGRAGRGSQPASPRRVRRRLGRRPAPNAQPVNKALCKTKGMGEADFLCDFGLGDDEFRRHNAELAPGDGKWVLADPENACRIE